MNDRFKDIILKTLLVIGMILLLFLFPGSILLPFLIPNEEIVKRFLNLILGSFFAVGLMFLILLPILGGLKPKPVKAEKVSLRFDSYNEFMIFLQKSLKEKMYLTQKALTITKNGEMTIFTKQSKRRSLDCVVIVRVTNLSDEMLEVINDNITDILTEYYGGEISDNVNMISIFCVDSITPAFQKLVNSNVEQGLKNGRLLVGILFSNKSVYIAKQTDGFAIVRYKRLRKELMEIMKFH